MVIIIVTVCISHTIKFIIIIHDCAIPVCMHNTPVFWRMCSVQQCYQQWQTCPLLFVQWLQAEKDHSLHIQHMQSVLGKAVLLVSIQGQKKWQLLLLSFLPIHNNFTIKLLKSVVSTYYALTSSSPAESVGFPSVMSIIRGVMGTPATRNTPPIVLT